jgi:hypothetical protein
VSLEARVRQRRPEAATYLQRVSITISVLVFADVPCDILGISFLVVQNFGSSAQEQRLAT